MNNEPSTRQDACWDAAWTWVQRQHEVGFGDPAFNAELAAWLQADLANRAAYDKAAKIWLLAGLVPPVNDFSPPSRGGDPAGE